MFTKELYLLILSCITHCMTQLSNDEPLLLNYCIDSNNHKYNPGPESSLFGQCSPWKSRSCCTENTTISIHEGNIYNFNYNHCSKQKNLSDGCLKHFTQDHCFYHCSPNVGPWAVKEMRSWRKERFYKVPLCADQCDSWFNDCKDDYTCTDNWARNFDWKVGTCDGKKCKTNFCPAKATCLTFSEIYKSAENFCQRVWDHSWEYTREEPCMKVWFVGDKGNPNDEVAAWKTKTLLSEAPPLSNWSSLSWIVASVIILRNV